MMGIGYRDIFMGPKEKVAIDSMAVTYLLQANTTDLVPTLDLDKERLAVRRIWRLQQHCDIYIAPTVSMEILRIKRTEPGTLPEATKLAQHRGTRDCFLLEILHLNATAVDQRAKEYNQYHPDIDDCYMVAESELADMDVLLTYDTDLLIHLRDRTTKLNLRKPTEYEAELIKRYGSVPRSEAR